MFRRYNRWWSRFDQSDPNDGSYALSDPQSLNRYAYVQNDPVNFVDPTGLDQCNPGDICFVFPPSEPNGGVGGIFGGGTGLTTDNSPIGEGGLIGMEPQNPQAQQPCTFNVNISGVNGYELIDMQNEIKRIFGGANLNVVFGQPGRGDAGSMNLVVTTQFTGYSPRTIFQNWEEQQ